MNKKDEQILKDAEKNNIPVFVFTAKDELSVETLAEYAHTCSLLDCPKEHIKGVHERINEFEEWQKANPAKVKMPD